MRPSSMHVMLAATALAAAVATSARTLVVRDTNDVEYVGLSGQDMDLFLGIPYAQDTSGPNRFKPPRPYVPAPGAKVDATQRGPACPQPAFLSPLATANITNVSENCLHLNIARPKGVSGPLPVMLWIHGGSFWIGSKDEPTTAPAGLIRQSVENGLPVMHVAINYRLGVFGFAVSNALKAEGSTNAGLRDQRLAMEWVRDNIACFGGDPEKITIFGQSSGGLAVGMQILAYGGTKPLPFQQAMAESQSLEPGITRNFTIDAMTALVDYVGCNSTSVHSPETVACLRGKDTDTLLNASIANYASEITQNIGDVWLPAVDGDFLPKAPGELIANGQIGNVSFTTGYTDNDLTFYTDTSIATANDTYDFIRGYLPGFNQTSLEHLLGMYPVSEFAPATNLSGEFFRAARVFRDILMVCPSLHLGAAVAKTQMKPVYYYDFNQTVVGPLVDRASNVSGLGPGHTSEFAYVFDSFRAYDDAGYQVKETANDYELMQRVSRSWSTFAATGNPVRKDGDTLQGWSQAYASGDSPSIMVIGGPHERLSPAGGPPVQKLDGRCAFLNDPDIIRALGY
ncbi:hypothetical protein ACEQ8H_006753 [Pleosporales sp. CAS-2024a]